MRGEKEVVVGGGGGVHEFWKARVGGKLQS